MSLQIIKTRFSWYFPLFLIIICSIGAVSSIYVYRSVNESLIKSLIYRAETISLALNSEEIAALKGDVSDTELKEYKELKDKLILIKAANKDSRFVYIMGMRNGELYFVADSENPESEDYSPPGQIYYEESPAFNNSFNSKSSGSEGPTSDRWGTWITGVAPILDDANQVIASVGIDVDANEFRKQVITYSSLPIVAALILIIFTYFGIRIRRQEKEFVEIKSKFVAIASHDIRSPLTGISWGMQSLVAGKSLQPKDQELASKINNQVQHLLSTSNDILDALAIDMAKNHFLNAPVKLKDVVDISVEAISLFAQQEKIELIIANLPDDAIVMGDQGKLQQLFTNVLSNAIKYSKNKKEVKLEYLLNKGFHEISITDYGIGIPKEDQKKVFNGFYRAYNAEALPISGTGLGLYLVKRIAELHDGQVLLESEENKGTIVTIKLPCSLKVL